MNVVIVDEDEPFRLALKHRLATLPTVQVVWDSSDAPAALQQMTLLRPELIVLDAGLEGGGALRILKLEKRRSGHVAGVVILDSDSPSEQDVYLKAGADLLVVRSGNRTTLLAAVVNAVKKLSWGDSQALHGF